MTETTMPTVEQLRRANIEHYEAEQLERLRAAESFQPTRPAPPIPGSHDDYLVEEEMSRFSDTDDESPSTSRVFSFARGASKRHVKNANGSLNRVRSIPSTDILDHLRRSQQKLESRPMLSRSVTIAAARALFASETLKSPSAPHFHHTWSDITEHASPEDKERYENFKHRGMVPPWKLMHENRKKSRQGSFAESGTLRTRKK